MKIQGRFQVIDSYKSADPKYPNTNFTLLDLDVKGQFKLSVPPLAADRLAYAQSYNLDCVCSARVGSFGLQLTYVSGSIDLVDPVNVPVKSK